MFMAQFWDNLLHYQHLCQIWEIQSWPGIDGVSPINDLLESPHGRQHDLSSVFDLEKSSTPLASTWALLCESLRWSQNDVIQVDQIGRDLYMELL